MKKIFFRSIVIIILLGILSIPLYKYWNEHKLVNKDGVMVERGPRVLSVDGRKQVGDIYSPDKKNKIVVFRGGGGATVADSIRFAVVSSDVSDIYTSDIVFAKKGHSLSLDRISSKWKNNGELVIGYDVDSDEYEDTLPEFTKEEALQEFKNNLDISVLTLNVNDIVISYKL